MDLSTGHAAGGQMSPVWHRLRFWYLPEPHYFLWGFDTLNSTFAFNVDLSTPALTYIREHQVLSPTGRQGTFCIFI